MRVVADGVWRIGRARLVAVAGLGLALSLGGCASGPSDFLNLVHEAPAKSKRPLIRTEAQQQALAAALSSQGRSRAVEAAGGADGAALMALTVMRQQQNEEAQALLVESGVAPAAEAACDDPAACPAADAATP